MSAIPFFLADAETQEVLASWRMTDPATRERLIIFGAMGLVTLAVQCSPIRKTVNVPYFPVQAVRRNSVGSASSSVLRVSTGCGAPM